ncbi:MAG: PAS domain-containing protein [Candidatus Omnitrophota bacterium]|nr:MAG: PAS domain-containing protein [Candidatus Omnitrophota bacterium]
MKKKREIKQDLVYKYKLLSYFVDHIPDVIYFKDKKGKLIMVNQAHAKGLGLKPKEVVGKTDFDFFSKKRAKMMTKDDIYVMRTGKPIIDKIERATRADGADNYVTTTKIPQYDDKGKIIGLMGITRDITRRMQFEYLKQEKARIKKKLEVLEELNKLKSEFVAAVSHELRTPLSIIKQLVMLIFNETTGPINKKQRETLKRTKDNIERLKKIVDELLDISKIERGRFKLHYSLVNLNDLLKDSLGFFKKFSQDKGIVLDYHLPRKEINIFIDVERTNQVLSNLIDNAIKFTEQNGKILVEVKVMENKVRIGVIDTGIGIAKGDLPRLFNKFVQVSKNSNEQRKGIGLGLSLVRELVERQGGEIWVESKLGVGSKFYFTLPRFNEPEVLDKQIKGRINNLLDKDISVYFINLIIVNFKELKKAILIRPRRMFKDLEVIIDGTLKQTCQSNIERPQQIVLTDIQNGKCNVIFSGITEKKANQVFNLLKDKIKKYLIKNKVKDAFVALGILSYPHRAGPSAAEQIPAKIYIKKINIGLEKRRFKRVLYETDIEILHPEDKTGSSQTVDISEGGICFVTDNLLETDSQIKIRLEFPKSKKTIYTKAHVAWRKMMERLPGQPTNRYKLGLEFINLKNKDREILRKELKL